MAQALLPLGSIRIIAEKTRSKKIPDRFLVQNSVVARREQADN
jgi:hypothetical protein